MPTYFDLLCHYCCNESQSDLVGCCADLSEIFAFDENILYQGGKCHDRQLGLLFFIVALVGCTQRSGARFLSSITVLPGGSPGSRSTRALVGKPNGGGKPWEDVPSAEPILVLREKAIRPMHPDVATRLNDRAELYRAWCAYNKAELLLVHALDLDIREKASAGDLTVSCGAGAQWTRPSGR